MSDTTPPFFELEVAKFFKQGKSKTEAIMEAIKKFPDLHAQYLERVQTGGYHCLAKAFGPGNSNKV